MQYGLKPETIKKIQQVFASFPGVEKAVLYGSRAKGAEKSASDIDITLFGETLNIPILNKIAWQLDDLLLPYTFDLSLFRQISNPDLVEHIHRVGKIFYEKNPDIA